MIIMQYRETIRAAFFCIPLAACGKPGYHCEDKPADVVALSDAMARGAGYWLRCSQEPTSTCDEALGYDLQEIQRERQGAIRRRCVRRDGTVPD